jgi:hypothetical protein
MPPAVAAIAVVAASVAVKVFVTSVIVAALLTVAISVAATLLMQKPKGASKLNQGAELRTKIDPTMPRQVLTGLIATGGSCHFVHTATNDAKKPNRYLYRVVQISDRPIHSLVRVMDASNTVGFSGDVTTGWRASTSYLSKSGAACMWMRVYLGSDFPTADATLISETGGIWTSAHKGKGLAYAIIKMDSDADAFPNGEPDFTYVVEGAHCYDDRKDSTVVGGSGSHRLNNYSTWEYTETASVITAQFMRGFHTNGVRIVGVGADERDLSTTMLFSAHNTCEQTVTVEAGSEARYVAGMIISSSFTAADVLEDFQAAMDGRIFDRGGAITILPGANRTPVMNLSDQDIVWSAEKSWQPQASQTALLNHVSANFIDRDKNFQEADLPVRKNSAWEVDDGGERFSEFFSFRAMNKRSQGQRITKRIHIASRYQGTCAFVGGLWLLELEQGDWFTLTTPRWSLTNKYFEVEEISLTRDMRVAIVGREVSPNIDGWDHSVDEVPRTDTTWVPPAYNLPVPAFTLSKTVETDATTGQQQFSVGVAVTDAATYGAFVKEFQFEISVGSTANPNAGNPFRPDQGSTKVRGLAPGLAYYVRVRTSDGTRSSAWTSWSSITTDLGTPVSSAQITVPGGTLDDVLDTIFSAYLTNGTHTVPATSTGVVTSYTGASGQFKIFRAATDVTSSFTYAVAPGGNPQALTGPFSGSPVDADGDYSVTGGLDAGESQATLTIRATGTGGYTGVLIDLTFSLGKSNAGVDGTSPPLIYVSSTHQTFRYDRDDTPLTQTTTITARRQNTAGTTRWRVYKADGTLILDWNTAAVMVSNSFADSSPDNDTLVINQSLFNANLVALSTPGLIYAVSIDTDSTISDRISIVKVRDGSTGPGVMTLVNKANTVVEGAKVTKVSGGDNWNASAHSLEGYSGNVQAVARIVDASGNIMVGLNDDPDTDATYTGGFYVYVTGGSFYAYLNGTGFGPYGAVANGQFVYARRRGANFEFGILGEAPRHTRATSDFGISETTKLYFDTSLYSATAVIDSCALLPLGADGAPAITALLTNESHTLPADASGTITSYSGAIGAFKIYSGATDVSASFIWSVASNPQALTAAPLIDGAGTYQVSGGFDAGEANASITYRGTGTGAYAGVIIDKTFSLAKSIAGASGTPGNSPPLIVVTSTHQTYTYNSAGVIQSQTTSINAARQNNAGTTVWDIYEADGTTLWSTGTAAGWVGTGYFTSSGADNLTMTHTDFNSVLTGLSTTGLVFVAKCGGVEDRISIVKVQDGATGSTGAPGVSPISLDLSAVAMDIAADSNNVTKAGVLPKGSVVSLTQAGVALTPTSVNFTYSDGGGGAFVADYGVVANTVRVTTANTVGWIDVNVVYASVTYTKRIAISRSPDPQAPPSQTSAYTSVTGSTTATTYDGSGILSPELLLQANGSGEIDAAFDAEYYTDTPPASVRSLIAAAKIEIAPQSTGTFSSPMSEATGSQAFWDKVDATPGIVTVSGTFTGLTAGAYYRMRVNVRKVSGSAALVDINPGNFSVSQ